MCVPLCIYHVQSKCKKKSLRKGFGLLGFKEPQSKRAFQGFGAEISCKRDIIFCSCFLSQKNFNPNLHTQITINWF
jgi:hypothetical protein